MIRVSGCVSKKQKENISISPSKENHKPICFPFQVIFAGSIHNRATGSCPQVTPPARPCPPTTPRPSSNQFCVLGLVPTHCKNLYPENKQPGDVSRCVPCRGPGRRWAGAVGSPNEQQHPPASGEHLPEQAAARLSLQSSLTAEGQAPTAPG